MGVYKKLFEPIRIGTMEVKNRFAMAPVVTNHSERHYSCSDWQKKALLS